MKELAYIGIDYHIDSISVAVIPHGKKEFYDLITMKNKDKSILRYFKKLVKKIEIKSCYEASCNGYAFQRKMKA